MITANYIQTPTGLQVRFNIPDPEKGLLFEFTTAADMAEAKRKLYFRLRRYIVEKISAFIRQRSHAIAPHPALERYAEKMAVIQTLRLQLEHYEKASYWQLCNLISRQAAKIELIAPRETSRFYGHYQRTILPIIQHCAEMKGKSE